MLSRTLPSSTTKRELNKPRRSGQLTPLKTRLRVSVGFCKVPLFQRCFTVHVAFADTTRVEAQLSLYLRTRQGQERRTVVNITRGSPLETAQGRRRANAWTWTAGATFRRSVRSRPFSSGRLTHEALIGVSYKPPCVSSQVRCTPGQ